MIQKTTPTGVVFRVRDGEKKLPSLYERGFELWFCAKFVLVLASARKT